MVQTGEPAMATGESTLRAVPAVKATGPGPVPEVTVLAAMVVAVMVVVAAATMTGTPAKAAQSPSGASWVSHFLDGFSAPLTYSPGLSFLPEAQAQMRRTAADVRELLQTP